MKSQGFGLVFLVLLGIGLALGPAASIASASSTTVTVYGSSNPFLSGMPNGSLCCNGDSAPAESPVLVTGIPLTAGSALTFTNVIGSVILDQGQSITIPGSALFQKDGKAAVWLVDKDHTVELKPIAVQRYQGDSVVVGSGLAQGDVVVTAGVQKLLPGQKVALMDASAAQ